jgi:hypothetical protein
MTQDVRQSAVVAIFDSRTSAEAAVVALHHEGLDLKRLSIGCRTPPAEQHLLDAVAAGQFLVLVRGTAEMIVHARAILGASNSLPLTTHVGNGSSHFAEELGEG